jgi:NitT/TauT family transport system substrate-binding protein
VKRESPIKTIGDFVGKTVGYTTPASVSEALLKLSLMAANVDLTKVTMKAAGGVGENLTLLTTGGLDAAFSIDPVYAMHKADVRLIFFARQYIPDFLQNVWVASPATLQKQRALLAGFIRAWGEAVDYVWAHPIDAAARYARATNQDPNLFIVTLADEHVRSYYGQGQMTMKGFETVVQSMRIGKLLAPDQRVDLAAIVDQSVLPPSLRANLVAKL